MYCSNCGKEMSDTASFCPYCGQKAENRIQDSKGSTPLRTYEGQPLNSGTDNQTKKAKKKHSPLIVFMGILFIIAAFFLMRPRNAGDSEDAGQSKGASQPESTAVQADPYYDDVVRCIQGTWYGFTENGEACSFHIKGTDCRMIKNLSPETASMVGRKKLTLDGYLKTTDIKGELQFWFSGEVSDNLYYTYDENTDSIELTYNGYKLGKQDEYNNIVQHLQGSWNDANWRNKVSDGYYFEFEDNDFLMSVYGEGGIRQYRGQFGISFDGIILLFSDASDTDFSVYYVYYESTDSIELIYKGNILEKQ